MRHLLVAAALTAAVVPSARAESASFSSLFKRVSSYLNAPAVKRSPRRAAVAAVRGGIPTDQGEDLDLRLLDRARALREALKRPDASARDEAALRPIYEALAASQFVQALSIVGAPEARGEAAAALESWAKEPRKPGLPAGVISLLTGPAARIDDKELVKAGWGRHARLLAPAGAAARPAATGWTAGEDAAKLDETLKGLSDSWLGKKLEPEQEAKAHLLAGQVYAALASADLKGRAPAAPALAATAAAVEEDGPAPAEASIPFEPKAIYQKASKSVVLILCASSAGSGELGTGSVVDAGRRRILTNAHVVIQDSTRRPWSRINVYFKPAKMTGDTQRDLVEPVEGKVIAWDPALDLALVEVAGLPAGTGAIALGRPDSVSVGDRVAAIGHPEQGGLWTLTTGVISTVLADLGGVKGKNAFQTDTSINRGNSGGPLLDSSGRLVGVNTSMSRKAADGLAITSINFAVRSDVAKRWMAGQGEKLAYGGAGAIATAPAMMAGIPDPVPAPMTAAAAPVSAPAAAPAAPPAPAARVRALPPAPKPMMIAEGKPFSVDGVIEAEISKMEDLGEEMHEEIKLKTKK
ncbi:MAG: serine protease [Elusimicrobia bacterium]|nr:serine protease [Elusimicrobiota bacterium]